jgi:putative endonuclease
VREKQDLEGQLTSTKDDRWWVYMVRCNDGSLYTGITTNVDRRLSEHNNSTRGASYTRGRRPVSLVYLIDAESRASASQFECKIKQLTRKQKERLIISRHLS